MAEINIPLLRKAVEFVEAEAARTDGPSRWYQGEWVTSASDMAEILAERELEPYEEDRGYWDKLQARAQELEPACGTAYCVAGFVGQLLDERYAKSSWPEGMKQVAFFAAEHLGLEVDEGNLPSYHPLFAATNTAADVRRIAEELAGEKL